MNACSVVELTNVVVYAPETPNSTVSGSVLLKAAPMSVNVRPLFPIATSVGSIELRMGAACGVFGVPMRVALADAILPIACVGAVSISMTNISTAMPLPSDMHSTSRLSACIT